MNEKLIHFLGQMASLLHNLSSDDPVARLQRGCLEEPRTKAKLQGLLEDCRELADLYDDLPDGNFEENLQN